METRQLNPSIKRAPMTISRVLHLAHKLLIEIFIFSTNAELLQPHRPARHTVDLAVIRKGRPLESPSQTPQALTTLSPHSFIAGPRAAVLERPSAFGLLIPGTSAYAHSSPSSLLRLNSTLGCYSESLPDALQPHPWVSLHRTCLIKPPAATCSRLPPFHQHPCSYVWLEKDTNRWLVIFKVTATNSSGCSSNAVQ